jgi:ATP-dependent DNA helicase RecG
LNNFLLKQVGKTWDDVIAPRVEIGDIDLKAIETFKESAFKSKRMPFIKNERNIEVILDNLLLLENNKLKRAGVLLFGKKPNRFYINAFVKIGRFGKTSDDLLFQEIVKGNIFELADKTLDILDKKFLIAKISYEGLHRVEQWEYPYEAVRETIINAIVHRDYMGAPIQISVYDDKIIVWNEGSLPNDLTIDDLKEQHSSRPHNPILASSFFKGGLIEAWGRGTVKIINECKNAGLPEPKIENVFGGIQVTLFKNLLDKTKLIELGLNIRQIKAIEHLKEYGEITNSKYQKINSISKATATRDLTELVEKYKLTEKKGETGIGTFYVLKGLKKGL